MQLNNNWQEMMPGAANVQPKEMTKAELLQRKLKSAMKYAQDVCVIGATNRMEDVKRTNGWSYTQQYHYNHTGRYERSAGMTKDRDAMFLCNIEYDQQHDTCVDKSSRWFYRVDDILKGRFCNTPIDLYRRDSTCNPFYDNRFHVYDDAVGVISSAMRAESTRSGNCGVQSRLVAKYLWEKHEGIERIEIVAMNSFDHAFVIVNRSGNIDQPETWGDAWIIDPWAMGGLIYPANEFLQKISEIKQFVCNEANQLFRLGLAFMPGVEGSDVDRRSVVDIRPGRDPYPCYDPYHLANDYYVYNDNRFTRDVYQARILSSIMQDRHSLKFDECLKEIQSIKKNPAWCRLFGADKNANNHDINIDDVDNNHHRRKYKN